nr:hypothetical protein [Oenococcus oeni]
MNKATHPLSDRIKNIPHDPMLDFLDKVEQSDDLVDLGFGDPDFAVSKKQKKLLKQQLTRIVHTMPMVRESLN